MVRVAVIGILAFVVSSMALSVGDAHSATTETAQIAARRDSPEESSAGTATVEDDMKDADEIYQEIFDTLGELRDLFAKMKPNSAEASQAPDATSTPL